MRKHFIKVAESKNKKTVLLSLDTIFDKGLPYAILKRKKQLPYYDYTLFSLNNVRLVEIRTRVSINKDRTLYYSFFFEASEHTAEVEKYYGYTLEKEIVKYGLVINNRIDPYNETRFLIKFPGKFSDTTIKTYITDDPEKDNINFNEMYRTVKRNRSAEFYLNDGKIVQDYKVVGRYKNIEQLIRFYLPSGLEVAEAEESEPGSGIWNITSFKDKKNWTITAAVDHTLLDITMFLSEKLYL